MTKKVILRIESIAPQGDGVSTQNNRFYYVPGAIPGDLVEVEVQKADKRGTYTKLLQIIEAGPHRRSASCKWYERCGGCSLLHVDETLQHRSKMENLARQFDLDTVPFVVSGPPLGYRRLARLHARRQKDGRVQVGFFGRHAHHIVDIDRCPILDDAISSRLRPLKEELFQHLERATIRISSGDNGVFVFVETELPLSPAFYKAAVAAVPNRVQGVAVEWEGIITTVAGEDSVAVTTCNNQSVLLPIGSFGQANAYVNLTLTATVARWVKQSGARTAVELYAGAGNLSVSFASFVNRLTLVEVDQRACAAAKKNMAAYDHVQVVCDDALQGYRSFGKSAELVVLDPPRTGAKDAVREMAAQAHREIIYVSCHPGSLKRDIGYLADGGYVLQELIGFDMFPQTAHVEAAARLTRREK